MTGNREVLSVGETKDLLQDRAPEPKDLQNGPVSARLKCPECVQGKHQNCTEDVLDENDDWVKCGCWPDPNGSRHE